MLYMLSIAVNGYGTIGKRVADAVAIQPDMQVVGVAKRRPNAVAAVAADRGYPLFVPDEESRDAFEAAGFDDVGAIDEMIDACDVVVDATPGGVGASYLPTYRAYNTPAILQGKEADDAVETSFCARANYENAVGASAVRVVSCNTTALARAIAPLRDRFGVEHVSATLVRRGGDPAQSERGPIDDIVPDPVTIPSHHGPDAQTVLGPVPITTVAMKVPTTLMHVHTVEITLGGTPSRSDVLDVFGAERRIYLMPERIGIDGIAQIREHGRDRGRPRGDVWESCVWEGSVTVTGDRLHFVQAVHQESNVIPENIDAIRAITGTADAETSMRRTDRSLGVGAWETQSQRRPVAAAPRE